MVNPTQDRNWIFPRFPRSVLMGIRPPSSMYDGYRGLPFHQISWLSLLRRCLYSIALFNSSYSIHVAAMANTGYSSNSLFPRACHQCKFRNHLMHNSSLCLGSARSSTNILWRDRSLRFKGKGGQLTTKCQELGGLATPREGVNRPRAARLLRRRKALAQDLLER